MNFMGLKSGRGARAGGAGGGAGGSGSGLGGSGGSSGSLLGDLPVFLPNTNGGEAGPAGQPKLLPSNPVMVGSSASPAGGAQGHTGAQAEAQAGGQTDTQTQTAAQVAPAEGAASGTGGLTGTPGSAGKAGGGLTGTPGSAGKPVPIPGTSITLQTEEDIQQWIQQRKLNWMKKISNKRVHSETKPHKVSKPVPNTSKRDNSSNNNRRRNNTPRVPILDTMLKQRDHQQDNLVVLHVIKELFDKEVVPISGV